MNGRTKQETIAAWRRVLTADLEDHATAADIADIVGISPAAAGRWLTGHVGPSVLASGPKGGLVGWWNTAAIRAAVEDMQGPGNRSGNRGKGRAPKAGSDQTSQEGNSQ